MIILWSIAAEIRGIRPYLKKRQLDPQVSIIFHILISALLVLEDTVIGLTILVSTTDIYQGHVQGFVLVGATGGGGQHWGQI